MIYPPRYALLISGESLPGARHSFLTTDGLALALDEHGGTNADLEKAIRLRVNKAITRKDKAFQIVRVR